MLWDVVSQRCASYKMTRIAVGVLLLLKIAVITVRFNFT